MNTHIPPLQSLSSPLLPNFNFRNPKPTLSHKFTSSSSNFHLFPSFLLQQTSIFNATRAINADNSVEVVEDESYDDLVIEASLTRILPPALTLELGLESLKNALQEFKLHPPSTNSGLIRFQVAVPPSTNALDLFSCQPETSGVFPQFYMSKHSENPTRQAAFFSKIRGVLGIGAAVSFSHSPSSTDEWNLFRRYLLVDSLNITAYGFMGINYSSKSSCVKSETDSFYFMIPQIELNECEGFSILAGTIVWSDYLGNFEQALHSYEISLLQATNHFLAATNTCSADFMKSGLNFINAVDKHMEMVYLEAPMLGSYSNAASILEMVSPSS